MAAPPPAILRVKVRLVIVVGSIAVLKVAFTVELTGTLIAALTGLVTVIVGAPAFAVSPVVKLHTKFAAMAVPVKFCAAVVIVEVYCVLAVRFALGVNTAVLPKFETIPGTFAPPTVTANVKVPGAKIVAGFMAVLNVAETF